MNRVYGPIAAALIGLASLALPPLAGAFSEAFAHGAHEHFAAGGILWKFTKRGAFEYACLIPGHFEAGMHGEVIVK